MDFATQPGIFYRKKKMDSEGSVTTSFCVRLYEGLVRGEMGTKISSRMNEDY